MRSSSPGVVSSDDYEELRHRRGGQKSWRYSRWVRISCTVCAGFICFLLFSLNVWIWTLMLLQSICSCSYFFTCPFFLIKTMFVQRGGGQGCCSRHESLHGDTQAGRESGGGAGEERSQAQQRGEGRRESRGRRRQAPRCEQQASKQTSR